MLKNLVIVESPAKAKTIEKFLGKDYKVMSSYGHIRDLRKKDISIKVDSDFQPVYEIPTDKKALKLLTIYHIFNRNCLPLRSESGRVPNSPASSSASGAYRRRTHT